MACPHDVHTHDHVTLDIDVPFGEHKLYIGNIRWAVLCVHTRMSCGGNTHYILCTRNGLGAHWRFMARLILHDDEMRIKLDAARYADTHDGRYSVGVLHDARNENVCGPWEEVK